MFCIKSSFADCFSCPLINANSCILETNSKENLKDIDVIFISENPGKKEIESEIPLTGKAEKIFRKYFDKYIKNEFKWVLTNTVLCITLNPDGSTGDPTDEIIDKCKENCFKIIEECNPKLIVLLGTIPMKAFGIASHGITDLRGKLYKWRGYNLYLTLNPSFINIQKNYEPKFEEDFIEIGKLLNIKKGRESGNFQTEKDKKLNLYKSGKIGPYYYKIPQKYYTEDYKLIDVQFLSKVKKVVYIFRDKNNEKFYHYENDDYYCYIPRNDNVEKLKVISYDDLEQIKVPYSEKYSLDPESTYEGDLKITVKHTHDYYLQKKCDEPEIDLNIVYLDIETFSESLGHSNVNDAEDYVVMITTKFKKELKTFVIDPKYLIKDNKQEIKKDQNTLIFKNEKDLLTNFAKYILSINPDILTGWYTNSFDLPYIINRMTKNRISPEILSPLKQVYCDFNGYVDIAGMICLDMIELYKQFVQNKRESYSLDAISNIHIDEGKLEKSSDFSKLYKTNVNRSIDYNIQDVILLEKLDERLKHIKLMDELRKICKAPYRSATSQMGQLDSLILSFLKVQKLCAKNRVVKEKEGFKGAFVKEPIIGLHDYLVDFDFTSLYPSIIMTLNIGINTFFMKLKREDLGYELTYNRDAFPEEVDIIFNPVENSYEKRINKNELFKLINDENLCFSINGCFFKKDQLSYYSTILELLLTSRRYNKKLMFESKKKKDENAESLYDIKQKVYKVLANALYGVLGNPYFRFFNVDCAKSITLTGQEMIKNSIIEAENYVDYLKTGKHIKPEIITKKEIESNQYERPAKHIVTSDTDSLFITFENIINKKDENIIEKIDKYCVQVQKFLNEEIIAHLVKKHNIDTTMNKLELKNELIIDRSLFLSKKHYAIHVIKREGVLINENISMGLDTKRSDYPSYTKECLEKLIDMILNDKSFSIIKIFDFIEDVKKEFAIKITKGDKTVARPVSFNKKIEEYKSITQAVRGMGYWNDIEYVAFQTGSKGYLFQIHGIDLEKAPENVKNNYINKYLNNGKSIDVIVLPEDEDRLPNYYIVKNNEMLDFAWKKRYELLLDPIIKNNEKTDPLTF